VASPALFQIYCRTALEPAFPAFSEDLHNSVHEILGREVTQMAKKKRTKVKGKRKRATKKDLGGKGQTKAVCRQRLL